MYNFGKLLAEQKGYTKAHWLSIPSQVDGRGSCHKGEPDAFHSPLLPDHPLEKSTIHEPNLGKKGRKVGNRGKLQRK